LDPSEQNQKLKDQASLDSNDYQLSLKMQNHPPLKENFE
jgi:hypothetical protein